MQVLRCKPAVPIMIQRASACGRTEPTGGSVRGSPGRLKFAFGQGQAVSHFTWFFLSSTLFHRRSPSSFLFFIFLFFFLPLGPLAVLVVAFTRTSLLQTPTSPRVQEPIFLHSRFHTEPQERGLTARGSCEYVFSF